MNSYRKVAFVNDDEVPANFVFTSVNDAKKYKELYSNNNSLFEFVDIDKISVNDFLFILSSGLFQVKEIKEQ